MYRNVIHAVTYKQPEDKSGNNAGHHRKEGYNQQTKVLQRAQQNNIMFSFNVGLKLITSPV